MGKVGLITRLSKEEAAKVEEAIIACAGERKVLKLSRLVKPKYQREVDNRNVAAIHADFTPDCCRPLLVAERKDGTCVIEDGGHRKAYLEAIGVERTICDVVKSKGETWEAAVYYFLNTHTKLLSGLNEFFANVVRGEATDTAISELIDKYHFEVGPHAINRFSCVRDMRDIVVKYGKGCLDRTLEVLRKAYGGLKASTGSKFFRYFSTYMGENKQLSTERVVASLRKLKGVKMPGDFVSEIDKLLKENRESPKQLRRSNTEIICGVFGSYL